MRKIRLLTSVILMCAGGGHALAQSPLEGPLVAPDSKPATAPAPPKKAARHKLGKTAHAVDYKASDHKALPNASAEAPAAQPRPAVAGVPQPNDPLSFGMKWNGANDDARATRVQNYNGDAYGTGAEVGMKLHF